MQGAFVANYRYKEHRVLSVIDDGTGHYSKNLKVSIALLPRFSGLNKTKIDTFLMVTNLIFVV